MQTKIFWCVLIFFLGILMQNAALAEVTWFRPEEKPTFAVDISANVSAQVAVTATGVRVTVQGQSQDLATYGLKDLYQGQLFVEAADFNFDGFVDLHLYQGVGYMGVNVFGVIFLFDPISQKFQKSLEVCNLEIQTQTQTLRGQMKSGAIFVTTFYQVKSQGELYKNLESRLVGDCLAETKYFDVQGKNTQTLLTDPCANADAPVAAKRVIAVEKAFFYSAPDAKALTKAYLIRGDSVTLLQISQDFGDWVLVEFVNKQKRKMQNWLPMLSLASSSTES